MSAATSLVYHHFRIEIIRVGQF